MSHKVQVDGTHKVQVDGTHKVQVDGTHKVQVDGIDVPQSAIQSRYTNLPEHGAVVLHYVGTVVSGHHMKVHQNPLPLLLVIHPHHFL